MGACRSGTKCIRTLVTCHLPPTCQQHNKTSIAAKMAGTKETTKVHDTTSVTKAQLQNTQQPQATTALQAKKKRKKKLGHGWTRRKTYKTPPPHPDNYRFDPLRRYKIRGIFEEDNENYHIEWARTDSKGDKFEDSWVPKKEFARKGKKYANNAAVRDWERRKRQGRAGKNFNDAPGEYDTSGSEYVTSADEDEAEESLKFRRRKAAAKAKGRD